MPLFRSHCRPARLHAKARRVGTRSPRRFRSRRGPSPRGEGLRGSHGERRGARSSLPRAGGAATGRDRARRRRPLRGRIHRSQTGVGAEGSRDPRRCARGPSAGSAPGVRLRGPRKAQKRHQPAEAPVSPKVDNSMISHYLTLPDEMTAFEARYVRRLNKIALWFFVAHLPAMMLIAWINGTGAILAAGLTLAAVAGPALAYFTLQNPRAVSVVYGVAAMFMGGVLVHVGQGPIQIEMHFYFFALIAMLAVFGNPMVIVVAAITVALHHLALWCLVPRSVFNYDAPVW